MRQNEIFQEKVTRRVIPYIYSKSTNISNFYKKKSLSSYSLIDMGVCVAYVKGQCRQNEITQRPCDTKISLEATALLKNSIDTPFHWDVIDEKKKRRKLSKMIMMGRAW